VFSSREIRLGKWITRNVRNWLKKGWILTVTKQLFFTQTQNFFRSARLQVYPNCSSRGQPRTVTNAWFLRVSIASTIHLESLSLSIEPSTNTANVMNVGTKSEKVELHVTKFLVSVRLYTVSSAREWRWDWRDSWWCSAVCKSSIGTEFVSSFPCLDKNGIIGSQHVHELHSNDSEFTFNGLGQRNIAPMLGCIVHFEPNDRLISWGIFILQTIVSICFFRSVPLQSNQNLWLITKIKWSEKNDLPPSIVRTFC
jgi:hypothetical protein